MVAHAQRSGLVLDEWQRFVLLHGLGYQPVDGAEQWTASKVSTWVPRQNGKGAIIEALELYWLFVMGVEEIVHSAHEHATSEKAYQRLERLIRDAPHLHRRVRLYRQTNGKQRIELHNGNTLQYSTRSGTAARGFSTPKLILDEAQELTDEHMAAIGPTVSAMPNHQVWFFGTPPRKADAWCYGLRADGEDGVPRLAHFDWGADLDSTDPDVRHRVTDRELWYATNPALGIRIAEQTVEDECRPSGLGEKFIHERLGVWLPSLVSLSLIDLRKWADYCDPLSEAQPGVAFALDSNPERTWSAIGMTGRRSDDLLHWQVLEHRPGMHWLLDRAVELNKLTNCGWCVDPTSPAGALIPDLEKANLTVHQVSGRDLTQACTSMLNAAGDGSGRHLGQVELDQAWRDARTATSVDADRFTRKRSTGDISTLMAITLSDHGLRVYGNRCYDLLQSFH